ncbi:MAG: RNA methyltransferase [Acidobacteria bacterium]|nr:RNA methyltransferase [Acidobacteriota bacterium]
MKSIASRQHPVVRAFRALAAEPDPAGVRLLLDGAHQVREARAAGLGFDAVAVASSRLETSTEEADLARGLEQSGVDVYAVGDRVLSAISPVRTPSGITAVARRIPLDAAEVCQGRAGFLVVAVDVQDAGNLGALIRAAEAGGATAVLVCGASASPFSWKALRGSMGSALRLPVAHGLDVMHAVRCLTGAGVKTVAAVPRGGRPPDAIDWTGRVALLVGGEGAGLGDEVAAQCDDRVTIPMTPPVESLNVAVAAAILVYAARRQRV